MPWTRADVIAKFTRRFPACDPTEAGRLLDEAHTHLCTRVPVATARFHFDIVDNQAYYNLDPTDVSANPWVTAPTTDYWPSQSSWTTQRIQGVVKLLKAWTTYGSTYKELIMTSYDQLDLEGSWEHRVKTNTSSDVSPTHVYVDYHWLASAPTGQNFAMLMMLAPIPDVSGATAGDFEGIVQVIPILAASGDYIPYAFSGMAPYANLMGWLYAPEGDRANVNSWEALAENSIRYEQNYVASRTRNPIQVLPAGYNARPSVR
jgi:hypothetical protein